MCSANFMILQLTTRFQQHFGTFSSTHQWNAFRGLEETLFGLTVFVGNIFSAPGQDSRMTAMKIAAIDIRSGGGTVSLSCHHLLLRRKGYKYDPSRQRA